MTGPEAGLERSFSDFAVWSWFVGDRHRDELFAEGDRYPTRDQPAFSVTADVDSVDSGAVDHMASRYLRFDPRLLPGGATMRITQPEGRWRNRLLLVALGGLKDRELGNDRTVTVRGWDAWDEVVFVLSNVDLDGRGYEVEVEYRPERPHPLTLAGLSGDEQEGLPNAEPFVVVVRDQNGDPFGAQRSPSRPPAAEPYSVLTDTTDAEGTSEVASWPAGFYVYRLGDERSRADAQAHRAAVEPIHAAVPRL